MTYVKSIVAGLVAVFSVAVLFFVGIVIYLSLSGSLGESMKGKDGRLFWAAHKPKGSGGSNPPATKTLFGFQMG
jgi:hypothetical protein